MAILRTFTAGLLCLFLLSSFASAQTRPNHDAAMIEVKAAEALSDQGQLDAALQALQAVVDKYPNELEAIGWAKFRRAQILDAGGRIDEAAREIKWPWEKCDNGSISNLDLKFWSGCLYAKCLYSSSIGGGMVSSVCRKSLDVFNQIGQNNPAMRENTGWLRYWKAAASFNERNRSEARTDADAAFQTGNEFHNGTMAARAKLLLGEIDLADGNLLSARNVFQQCVNDYAPTMPPAYAGEVHANWIRCECRFGLLSQALRHALSVFESNAVGQDLQANALVAVAEEALAKSATDTAIQALALQRQAIPDVGAWSEIGDHLWTVLSESYDDRFLGKLDAVSQTATSNLGAAVDLSIYRIHLSGLGN